MMYLELFLTFFKIGCVAFGGAYGAIPLFREEVLSHSFMTKEMFTNVVAISESTPGPIMLNIATYVGAKQGGVIGAILATLGVILPSFIIIIFVMTMFKSILQNSSIQCALKGMKQCIMGFMIATSLYIGFQVIFNDILNIKIDYIALGILFFVLSAIYLAKKKFKKEISPIMIILISSTLGIILY